MGKLGHSCDMGGHSAYLSLWQEQGFRSSEGFRGRVWSREEGVWYGIVALDSWPPSCPNYPLVWGSTEPWTSEHSKHFNMNLYFFPIYIYNCFTGDGRGGRTGTLDSKYRGLMIVEKEVKTSWGLSWAQLRLRQLNYSFIKSLSLVETRFNLNWVTAQLNLVWLSLISDPDPDSL